MQRSRPQKTPRRKPPWRVVADIRHAELSAVGQIGATIGRSSVRENRPQSVRFGRHRPTNRRPLYGNLGSARQGFRTTRSVRTSLFDRLLFRRRASERHGGLCPSDAAIARFASVVSTCRRYSRWQVHRHSDKTSISQPIVNRAGNQIPQQDTQQKRGRNDNCANHQ